MALTLYKYDLYHIDVLFGGSKELGSVYLSILPSFNECMDTIEKLDPSLRVLRAYCKLKIPNSKLPAELSIVTSSDDEQQIVVLRPSPCTKGC